jgi:hypothetical protein
MDNKIYAINKRLYLLRGLLWKWEGKHDSLEVKRLNFTEEEIALAFRLNQEYKKKGRLASSQEV